jgi:hypothetical protein
MIGTYSGLDLVDDPEWDLDCDSGGIHWVDPIARRYYLPAALVRSLKDLSSFDIAPVLTCRRHGDLGSEFFPDVDLKASRKSGQTLGDKGFV